MRYLRLFPLLLVMIGVCIYLLFSTYSEVERKTIEQVNLRQFIHAKQAAHSIESFFNHYSQQLDYLSKLAEIISLDDKGKELMAFFYESNRDEIEGIRRVDADGRLLYIVPVGQKPIETDFSERDHIRRLMHSRKPVVSEVFTASDGFPCVALYVPVFEGETYRGSVGVLVPFERLAKKHLDDIKVGEEGYAWLISKGGLELFCPVPGHVGKSVFDNCKDFRSILTMAHEMVQGKQGITTYTYNKVRGASSEMVRKHAVYFPIHLLGDTFWSIVVATPENDVLGILKGFRTRWFILVAAIVTIGSFWLYLLLRAFVVVKEEKKRKRAEELVRIQRDLALALGSVSNLDEALDILLQTVLRIEGVDSGGVYLVDSATGEVRLICHKGLSSWFVERVSHYGPGCPQVEFIMRGEPAYWSNPRDVFETGDLFEKEGLKALAAIPVKWGNRVVALLNLASHRHEAIPSVTRGALEATASQIGSIIARVRAQDSLRESEKRFRELAENIREVFWVRTADEMLYISPAYEEIWGCSRESLHENPSSFMDTLHPDDREHVLEAFLAEREQGAPSNEEYRIIRPDGKIRWIWARSFPVREDGKVVHHVGIAEDITERKEAEKVLRQSEGELRLLSSRLLSAQEEERKRIAHELHDSIGASLGTITFSLKNALGRMQEGAATPELIEEIIALVEHTIADARQIYTNLRPSMLDHLGIIPTIGWFIRQFESAQPGTRIEKLIAVEEEQIPESIKIVIFRILQESFHNIAKYSRADLVRLSLTEAGGTMELAISDNGTGFDVDAAFTMKNEKGGIGLTSMRERVQLSGGTFAIESAVGQGTRIRASWQSCGVA